MKFTKFGKALSMGALSAGVVFGVSSCVESYTVGYLYVTGTVTASSGNNGIISGFKIDHNTGKLTTINGLPVSSGGANPVRAVLTLAAGFFMFSTAASMMPATAIATARAPPSARTPTSPSSRWAATASSRPGDLLYPGPQSVPADRRLLGQLSVGAGPRRAGQRQPVEH